MPEYSSEVVDGVHAVAADPSSGLPRRLPGLYHEHLQEHVHEGAAKKHHGHEREREQKEVIRPHRAGQPPPQRHDRQVGRPGVRERTHQIDVREDEV